MKRHEKGQGLVEYALILVLVAEVAIAILNLLGPQIAQVVCEVSYVVVALDADYFPTHERSMGRSVQELTIDVTTDFERSCRSYLEFRDIDTFPSHGTVVNEGEGVFTYRSHEVGSETDDSFTYSWRIGSDDYTGKVTIIIGKRDRRLVSKASIMRGAKRTVPGSDDVEESIEMLWEEAAAQEESLEEGVDLTVEAVVEGLEVLRDYADDIDKQAVSEALSQLVQEVRDGNLDAVPDAITLLVTDLTGAPDEVAIAMSLKMAPRLIDSLAAVSGGTVSPETIAGAQQALEQLDPDHPGITKAQQRLQVAVDIIEERNNAIEDYREADCVVLGSIITLLESVGEEDWAEQFAADSEACSY